ncbi:13728_t:CDS:2 [Dentiscutata heterogama]|uniref:13728_t:CDS:1 n=1 Tax=Dentiscutata heterogama TaxID=1316150 RepID=A0ACA9LRH1_9GLOM|nr:13728_t:CDS:2 [Dentiscutata heterogama]
MKKNISYNIQTLTDKEQLKHELSYTSIKHFLFETSLIKNVNFNDRFQFPILYQVVDEKCIELQDQGFGEVEQSKGLTKEEIYQILSYLNSDNQTALRLTQKVIFWNTYLLGLCGGDHYQLLLSCFEFQPDRSLIFMIGCEKNNQGGLKGCNKYRKFSSRHIYIPEDLLNKEYKPVQNLQNYINIYPPDACEKFYLLLTRNLQEIQDENWFLKSEFGKHILSNMMNNIAQAFKINITD